MKTELVARMREEANRQSDANAEQLRAEAARLEAAISNCGGIQGIPQLVGAWARARHIWCEITGEPLP